MRFMNDYEIDEACRAMTYLPNAGRGALVLSRLAKWTDQNSDGWAYWPKPTRAASKLMELIQGVDRWDPQDVSEQDLKKALTPIRSFLTREGVDHEIIFSPPKAMVEVNIKVFLNTDSEDPYDLIDEWIGKTAPVEFDSFQILI